MLAVNIVSNTGPRKRQLWSSKQKRWVAENEWERAQAEDEEDVRPEKDGQIRGEDKSDQRHEEAGRDGKGRDEDGKEDGGQGRGESPGPAEGGRDLRPSSDAGGERREDEQSDGVGPVEEGGDDHDEEGGPGAAGEDVVPTLPKPEEKKEDGIIPVVPAKTVKLSNMSLRDFQFILLKCESDINTLNEKIISFRLNIHENHYDGNAVPGDDVMDLIRHLSHRIHLFQKYIKDLRQAYMFSPDESESKVSARKTKFVNVLDKCKNSASSFSGRSNMLLKRLQKDDDKSVDYEELIKMVILYSEQLQTHINDMQTNYDELNERKLILVSNLHSRHPSLQDRQLSSPVYLAWLTKTLAEKEPHRARHHSRMRDIAESQHLLLELVTTEPTILQCFKIIESTCLSQGIFCRVQNTEVSQGFRRFLEDHYLPFCKAAIRAMFTYGFVPWRVRRLAKGDEVPEVLAPGTFTWHTEVGPEEQGRAPWKQRAGKRSRPSEDGGHLSVPEDDDSRLVVYRVTPTAGSVREEDISVYITHPPALDVSTNSNLYATVPTPLSYLLTDYKNLREAQKRRSHADAWNTTARLVSTFKPNLRTEDNPTQYLMDFVHEDHYARPTIGDSLFPQFSAHNVWQREHVMRRQIMDTPSNHHPEVYALPRDHDVVPQSRLEPCEDLSFLLDKYRRDVSAILGVPHEMVIGREGAGHETARKTVASGRIFSTNMHEICRHLQTLLRQASVSPLCIVFYVG